MENIQCNGNVCYLGNSSCETTTCGSADISTACPVISVDMVTETPPTFPVKLNTEIIPAKFSRYRHPSHSHKLFMTIARTRLRCDNLNCRRDITPGSTSFSCVRCDFDLCEFCFQLAGDHEVPISPRDSEVNEVTARPLDTVFSVRVEETRRPRVMTDETPDHTRQANFIPGKLDNHFC